MSNSTNELAQAALGAAERHMYEAELALHDALQTHVDEWIKAAGDRLHDAIAEYLAVQHEAAQH